MAFGLWYFRRAPTLSERSTILLGDFENKTSDAIFDSGILKQALAIKLTGTPYISLLPDEQIQESLGAMARPADTQISADIAREICFRRGLKAYIAGSITGLGSSFALAIRAVEAESGTILASALERAESKEKILETMDIASRKLRRELGESFSSIQKNDTPLQEATTSSLEALRAYSEGVDSNIKGDLYEAIISVKRAVDLDPNFAQAYSLLSGLYYNTGQAQSGGSALKQAYQLKDRASQVEKSNILYMYHRRISGDLYQAIEAAKIKSTYPMGDGFNALGICYNAIGQFEMALEAYRKQIQRFPGWWFYSNIAGTMPRMISSTSGQMQIPTCRSS